jgi:predicted ArsR family transcriptional regulator
LAVPPKLRAKGGGRVVELLLADDAVSLARAARSARLSDRAARRLFDRLFELGTVRELSGRPAFRLYGL